MLDANLMRRQIAEVFDGRIASRLKRDGSWMVEIPGSVPDFWGWRGAGGAFAGLAMVCGGLRLLGWVVLEDLGKGGHPPEASIPPV